MTAGPIQNPHLDSSPFLFEGGPCGVLLLHGFTATPVEVKLVGRYLHQRGYTVSGPLLPGHGTTIESINACRWRDWVDHAARAYAELAARCARVFVGGESLAAILLGARISRSRAICAPALGAAAVHSIASSSSGAPQGTDDRTIVNALDGRVDRSRPRAGATPSAMAAAYRQRHVFGSLPPEAEWGWGDYHSEGSA
jgi:alpha-beta hydrolase superfamily lysophospholipase